MGYIQRSIVYPDTMFDVVELMLGYMKQHGYGDYVREELVDRTLAQLRWAREKRQSQVAFLTFWWLYTTWEDYIEMTNDVEREANPLSSSPADLSEVRFFVCRHMAAFRSSAYLPCNVNVQIEALRRAFLVGAHLRMPAVLRAPTLDPTRVDKEDKPPAMFLPRQDQEFSTRLRKTVAEYVRQTDWSVVEGPPSSQRDSVVYVPTYDETGAESIV